ncbi:MAG: DNA polymerase III subunit delta' [Chloroflexi bacterium RBG_16_68_14]|nr:MAG: DNA polymerase III subunit delta' [Chloroflexi bacterium RBG_16_68_14]
MTWDIIGQDAAVAVLRRAVEDEERLSHAYLFAGPEHVGRATAARRFAQALNCSSAERPCGDCRSCRLIAEDKHPDVEWVGVGGICDESEHRDHGADGSRDIRICQVRRLERVVSRTAFEGRYRVIVIDPAEAMTAEAANAFLKTLEEPAPNVVLVLITAREEALRETVRSRCRRIAFSGVPRVALEAALRERWHAEPQQAARLARLAQGRLGWAVAALQDERLLIDRERTINDMESLLAGGFNERFAYAASLGARYSRDAQTVHTTLDVWRDWWRDVLLAAAGQEELTGDPERLDTLRSHAAQYGIAGALQALAALTGGRRHLEEHASPTLALEVMLLELPLRAGARGR